MGNPWNEQQARPHVLVADAHHPLRQQVREFLQARGFSVSEAMTPEGVISRVSTWQLPAALVIFHGAGDGQWAQIARHTRSAWKTTPFLFFCRNVFIERSKSGGITLSHFLEVPFAWDSFARAIDALIPPEASTR